MYTLRTWFVSGICVWLPCINETTIIIIIIIIIIGDRNFTQKEAEKKLKAKLNVQRCSECGT